MTNNRRFWLGAEAPWWWHRTADGFDRASGAVSRLSLPLLLRGAPALGRLMHRVQPNSPPVQTLSALFDLPRKQLLEVAREMSALRYRNRALVSAIRRQGVQALDQLACPGGVELLQPFRHGPVVFATWHVGAIFGIGMAFAEAGIEALAIRRAAGFPATRGLDVVAAAGGVHARAQAFTQAVARLKRGGVVIVAVDGTQTTDRISTRCLGRAVSVARGAFALARITGAPLVPIVPRWLATGATEVVVGGALSGQAAGVALEQSLADAAAGWLDEYLKRRPEQLWLHSLRWLSEAPTARTTRPSASS